MPRPRILPSDTELIAMRDRGMTHEQIADEVFRRTNYRVARSTVSVALVRAGAAAKHPRYKDIIPWTLSARFASEYPVRMLRLFGRRESGGDMSEDESARLDAWLESLAQSKSVVAFCPDVPTGENGFVYIPESAKDHDGPEPTRREVVRPEQIGYPAS